jgi:hypothetical protein
VQRLLAAPEDITDDAIDVILRAGKAACVTEASLTSVHSQLLAARRLAGSAAVSRMPATSSALQLGGASHGGGAAP